MAQFKIGDKVRITSTTRGIRHGYRVGATATIKSRADGADDYQTIPDAPQALKLGYARDMQWVHGSALELVQPPVVKTHPFTDLPPAEQALLAEFKRQGSKGLSGMDALRALGMSGASFTKRVSVLRKAGLTIDRKSHKDPISNRIYGRYTLVGG